MAWSFAAYNIVHVALANSSGFLVLILGGIAIIRHSMTLSAHLDAVSVQLLMKNLRNANLLMGGATALVALAIFTFEANVGFVQSKFAWKRAS